MPKRNHEHLFDIVRRTTRREGKEIVVNIKPPKRMAWRCGGEDQSDAGAVRNGLFGF